MIAKFIYCHVNPETKEAFSQGQREWDETAKRKGFISQYGGWDKNTDTAIILALWRDAQAVNSFMQETHDSIAQRAHQERTYSSICVSYLDEILTIPSNNHPSKNTIPPTLIRIADCKVYPDRELNFIKTQESVWNPGMVQVRGMLGGYLWRFSGESSRYLVTTFWASIEDHQNYTENYFSDLRNKAAVELDISNINGYQVYIEKEWGIYPGDL